MEIVEQSGNWRILFYKHESVYELLYKDIMVGHAEYDHNTQQWITEVYVYDETDSIDVRFSGLSEDMAVKVLWHGVQISNLMHPNLGSKNQEIEI